MNEIGDWLSGNYQFIVGTVLGVVGAYAIFQRRPNTLDYTIKSNSALINKGAAATDRNVQVTVDDVRLADPHFILIRIRNTGKHPIKKIDFDRWIMVRTGDQNVFDVSVVDQSEPGVIVGKEDCMIEMHAAEDMPITVSALPNLMNAGDWFDLSVLCDGEPENITVEARWAGQDRPMRDAARASQSAWRRGIALFCIASMTLGLAILLASDHDEVGVALLVLGAYFPGIWLFTKATTILIDVFDKAIDAILRRVRSSK